MTERVAAVVTIVEEGPGEIYLTIGDGVDFDRWKLTESQNTKIAIESFPIAIRKRFVHNTG